MKQSASFLSVLVLTTFIGRAADQRPNILFIMSDDHTAQAVGAYATVRKDLNPTPTIDTLAAEGMTFDNAFCTNAICTPSRACIMSGQYSAINGCMTLYEKLSAERQYLSMEMKKAGYQTAVVGKWHLKERPSTFDYFKVFLHTLDCSSDPFAVF